MEDHDHTLRFKDKMRITIKGSIAVFEATKKKRTELVIHWLGGQKFEVDWSAACSCWRRGVLHLAESGGVK